MNKDKARLVVMGAISMALKDPILQQGFEIICKELEELKKEQFSLRNERNTFLAQNEQYEKDLIDLKENLTKAKDIIRALLKHTYGQNLKTQNDFDLYLGRIKEAEQFLSEVEK